MCRRRVLQEKFFDLLLRNQSSYTYVYLLSNPSIHFLVCQYVVYLHPTLLYELVGPNIHPWGPVAMVDPA